MIPFFDTLPTDLQLCVIQSWLGNQDGFQLLALSAMDIACCNHALREPFLFLASHPSNRLNNERNHLVTKDLHNFMRWLASRKVPAQELYLTDRNLETLLEQMDCGDQTSRAGNKDEIIFPSIRTVMLWETKASVSAEGLRAVLASCPQVTAVLGRYANQVALSILDILLSIPALPLIKMSLMPSKAGSFPPDVFERALTAFPSLQVLQVPFLPATDAILTAVTIHCQLLEKLYIKLGIASIASVCQVLRSSSTLRATNLFDCPTLSTADVDNILQAVLLKLNTLSLKFLEETNNADALFLHGLQNMPAGLAYLRIGQCIYNRWNAGLSLLRTHQLSNAALNELLDVCPDPIRSLQLSPPIERAVSHTLSDRVIGEFLVELTIESVLLAKLPLPTSLFNCPKLMYLNLRNHAMADVDLHVIDSICHELNRLWMAECSNHQITDAGMEDLFAGCPLLQDVHVGDAPNITLRTLQAIVLHKLKLTRFSWKDNTMPAFGEEGLDQFREMVREQQLLPIPNLFDSCPMPMLTAFPALNLERSGVFIV